MLYYNLPPTYPTLLPAAVPIVNAGEGYEFVTRRSTLYLGRIFSFMEKTIQLQTLDEAAINHRGKPSVSESKAPSDFDRDKNELARVGKKQVLKVCKIKDLKFRRLRANC